jgi:hypothetical protein
MPLLAALSNIEVILMYRAVADSVLPSARAVSNLRILVFIEDLALTFLARFTSLILILFIAVLLFAIWNTSLIAELATLGFYHGELINASQEQGIILMFIGYSISKGGITICFE